MLCWMKNNTVVLFQKGFAFRIEYLTMLNDTWLQHSDITSFLLHCGALTPLSSSVSHHLSLTASPQMKRVPPFLCLLQASSTVSPWAPPWLHGCGDLLCVVPMCCRRTDFSSMGLFGAAVNYCSAPGASPALFLHWPWCLQVCFSIFSIPFPSIQHYSLAHLWPEVGPFVSQLEMVLI